MIIGFNHHFGRKGEGDFNTIKQCTESLDFMVEQVEGFQSEGGAISSSSIREALLQGRLEEANKLLGYAYSVSGTVIEGRRIGRSIGFPTANINPADRINLYLATEYMPLKSIWVDNLSGDAEYRIKSDS